MSYVPPSFNLDAFNCPLCGAYAHQEWSNGYSQKGIAGAFSPLESLKISHCSRCKKYSMWLSYTMVFPMGGNAPLPHPDLPWEIMQDYEEARKIVSSSPRSATALLRLSIEKLTDHILDKEKGKDLNDNIGKLVKLGLPTTVQQSLDILRVIGNNALHPGQIDLKDDQQTASKLFDLVNLITDYMITKPKQIKELYGSLPDDSKKGIERRDKASN